MNSLKFLLIGMALGSIATVAIASNCKITNRLKETTECASETLNTMFKIK